MIIYVLRISGNPISSDSLYLNFMAMQVWWFSIKFEFNKKASMSGALGIQTWERLVGLLDPIYILLPSFLNRFILNFCNGNTSSYSVRGLLSSKRSDGEFSLPDEKTETDGGNIFFVKLWKIKKIEKKNEYRICKGYFRIIYFLHIFI